MPKVVDDANFAPGGYIGFVKAPSNDPSMMIVSNKAREFYRLSWNEPRVKAPAVKRGGQALPLIVDRYSILTYRVHRRGKDGEYMLSFTRPRAKELLIERGKVAIPDVAPEVHIALKAKRKGEMLQIVAGLTGIKPGGVTIYKDGKRISLPYLVVDESGKQVAHGTMKYG